MSESYFTLTIDVEPDCSPTWHYSNPLSFAGVHTGIASVLHPICLEYGIKPTYLINNVVLEDIESINVLRSLEGTCELGTHLHAEFIEPEKRFANYAGRKAEANQCFLNPEIEYEKIKAITNLFSNQFGFQPRSFRAGRFSAGPNTIRCLKELGYIVDTSVTPHINWNDSTRERPVDYTNAFEQPYFVKQSTLMENDDEGTILEVPISIVEKKNLFRRENIWLRPYYSDYNKMKFITKKLITNYQDQNAVVINMMFHNVEVLPAISPYSKTEDDCRAYLENLANYFKYINEEKIISVTLSEVYDAFSSER